MLPSPASEKLTLARKLGATQRNLRAEECQALAEKGKGSLLSGGGTGKKKGAPKKAARAANNLGSDQDVKGSHSEGPALKLGTRGDGDPRSGRRSVWEEGG